MRKTARQLFDEVRTEMRHLQKEAERLSKLQGEVLSRLKSLTTLAEALAKVLNQEPVEQRSLPGITTPEKPSTPLGSFLRSALADGTPKSLEELADIAAKTIPSQTQGKSIRRMINFALYALKRHGAVERNNEGRWQIRQRH